MGIRTGVLGLAEAALCGLSLSPTPHLVLDTGSFLYLKLTDETRQASPQAPGISSCLPDAGIANRRHHTQICAMPTGEQTQTALCMTSTLLAEPSLLVLKLLFATEILLLLLFICLCGWFYKLSGLFEGMAWWPFSGCVYQQPGAKSEGHDGTF